MKKIGKLFLWNRIKTKEHNNTQQKIKNHKINKENIYFPKRADHQSPRVETRFKFIPQSETVIHHEHSFMCDPFHCMFLTPLYQFHRCPIKSFQQITCSALSLETSYLLTTCSTSLIIKSCS